MALLTKLQTTHLTGLSSRSEFESTSNEKGELHGVSPGNDTARADQHSCSWGRTAQKWKITDHKDPFLYKLKVYRIKY